jgi:transcriptional regulator NrdR family protein
MICPECSSERTGILESRPTARGVRRRRRVCTVCLYRWSTFGQDIVEPAKKVVSKYRRYCRREVIEILKSDLSQDKLALMYDTSRQVISRIKLGILYKDIHDEFHKPRTGAVLYCMNCINWSKRQCGLGFPEAGGDFATDCAVYKPNAFAAVVQ